VSVDHVPFLDLRRETGSLDAELQDAFARVLGSGRYILGPEVEALEAQCAQLLGVKHALGVSSGTDALLLALMTLGIGAGDEVICPTYTFFATAGVVWRTGARPVFVDVLPCCYNLDPSGVAARVTPRTRAIIPVHLFGQCAHMDPILQLASSRGIAIVEDAAQAIGASTGGRRAGTMGRLGCFSFFPSKNVGALGDAGLLVTDDDALAAKARVLRTHGAEPKYHHALVGGNFRMDALQAALLRVKLTRLDASTARRQANARLYRQLFEARGLDGTRLILPAECQETHVYHQYVVRVPDPPGRHGTGSTRDGLRTLLAERRVGTEVYYPVPMHLQPCFSALGGRAGDLPQAEGAAVETLALPIFPELTHDEIEYVTHGVAAMLG
jgi:dTDP-4-amino-4,6-dideoxygalactose transaminase